MHICDGQTWDRAVFGILDIWRLSSVGLQWTCAVWKIRCIFLEGSAPNLGARRMRVDVRGAAPRVTFIQLVHHGIHQKVCYTNLNNLQQLNLYRKMYTRDYNTRNDQSYLSTPWPTSISSENIHPVSQHMFIVLVLLHSTVLKPRVQALNCVL